MPVNIINGSQKISRFSEFFLEKIKKHSTNKNVQVIYIELTPCGIVLNWEKIVDESIKKYNDPGIKIIFSAISEAPFKEHIVEILQKYQNAIYIDSGRESFHPRHVTISTFFNFSIQNDPGFKPIPFENRDTYFVCLNRQYRIYRSAFVKLLFASELSKKGIITLNNTSTNPEHNIGLNKITIDLSEDPKNQYNSLGKNALINITTESSFFTYNTQHLNYNSFYKYPLHWNRVFVTEKTIKPFLMYQLPIFLTVNGHVKYLKVCGFDMFEDFIDHSYDNVSDPLLKISAVYSELHRLCKNSLKEIQSYCSSNQKRFEYNAHLCRQVYEKEWELFMYNIIRVIGV